MMPNNYAPLRTVAWRDCRPLFRWYAVAAHIMGNRHESRIAVLISTRSKITLEAHAFDDIDSAQSLPEEYSRGLPRLSQHFRRDDGELVVEHVRFGEPDTFGNVHVAIIRNALRLADCDIGLRVNGDRINDEGIAFPVSDGMPVEGRIGIRRVRTAICVNAPQPVTV